MDVKIGFSFAMSENWAKTFYELKKFLLESLIKRSPFHEQLTS